MQAEDHLDVERLGGLAGMGGPGSHIRSRGQLHGHELSATDRTHLAGLFAGSGHAAAGHPGAADGFRYRLTLHRAGAAKPDVVEVPESAVPERVRASVSDELI